MALLKKPFSNPRTLCRGPQSFWHQESIQCKTISSWTGKGGGFRVTQVHYIYLDFISMTIVISSTSDHQAFDPGGWDPWLRECAQRYLLIKCTSSMHGPGTPFEKSSHCLHHISFHNCVPWDLKLRQEISLWAWHTNKTIRGSEVPYQGKEWW